MAFHVYRLNGSGDAAQRLTTEPVRESTNFVDAEAPKEGNPRYFVRPVLADSEGPSTAAVAPAGHGTLVLSANGSLIYTPAADYHGTDRFTYKVRDGVADSNVATVTITVTPVNDAPLALGDSYAIYDRTKLHFLSTMLLNQFFDELTVPVFIDLVAMKRILEGQRKVGIRVQIDEHPLFETGFERVIVGTAGFDDLRPVVL